ncbi:MAG: hypothetical protein M4579_003965 [Chaenotheca gracillima]|nr:MAG: hypothetical protein M4579_003965 [Chaenotheca gracillima]
MAEDDDEDDDSQPRSSDQISKSHILEAIESDDLKSNVYEGGLKSWECSVDLAGVLTEDRQWLNGVEERGVHAIELGAGTALPTLSLFRRILELRSQTSQIPHRPPIIFTVADYNIDVLRLVTIPNMLLTWALQRQGRTPEDEQSGDLDVPPSLRDSFQKELSELGISIRAISGAWSPEFSSLLSTPSTAQTPQNTLILASETIYAPNSLAPFLDVLVSALRAGSGAVQGGSDVAIAQGPARARALVAAKRMYFGVGGGVDEFVRAFEAKTLGDGFVKEVKSVGGGVARVVLEVGLDKVDP